MSHLHVTLALEHDEFPEWKVGEISTSLGIVEVRIAQVVHGPSAVPNCYVGFDFTHVDQIRDLMRALRLAVDRLEEAGDGKRDMA